MSGKASSSQSSISVTGSGALSHVYIQHPPLRCNIPGSRGLFCDDGNKLLLSPTSDQVFSWKTVPFNPLVGPTSDSISEGPIISIRYSLDAKFIAIQRSNHEIQFWNRETGETFSQKCSPESESILGFFWTDCHLCDIVFVKTSGLDLYAYNSESKSLHLVETKKLNVSWYVYTHESRLVLLASGMQCKTFNGFQLSSAEIVRLPRFEMVMAKADANNKPVLAAEDVYIVTVYGRIYCLQVDRVAMLLHSYRLYRDAVVQQGSLPIYSSRVAVSVVDNVLLVHQVDAKVVILYDIFADSRAPISAPLPLLLRGFPRSSISASRFSGRETESSETNIMSDHEAITYGDEWNFLVPDLICDFANKLLWKIHLDLEAISSSSSEVPSVLEFLQRRKLEASKAKQLCLGITRTIILERRPVSMVSKAIHALISSYSHSVKTGSYVKGMKSDETSASGVPHSPISGSHVSSSGGNTFGKSSRHESAARVDRVSLNRSSTLSNSDPEENASFEKSIINVSEAQVSAKLNREKSVSAEAHKAEATQSSLQSGQQEFQLTSPAISPDEMYSFVFSPVDEEMVGDPSYLVSIIVEFLHSVNLEKIKVHPNLYILTIQLLARNERYAELGLFVINKILEPSKEVAFQLLESGRQNSQTRKLGLDMLRQLGLHNDYVLLLVQDGYYLEALRYARKYRVDTVRPSLYLEAAFASNNSQHLSAVLRFFSDFIPGFRNTSEHDTYFRILNEMNSSITA
ncbi:Colon cancer-associated Mic1-like protein [Quillaja saponaria]|uniref:Colon cancer-associated Mic1-like protein n=1 Tax=Quillaja saponaria TaxID=32244 RepID=A0AAD7Q6X8_QUISA|nr:Colon cancer-associated Mic1-like protein [Quillaja saponaria]